MSRPETTLVPLSDVAAPKPNSFVDGPFGSEMKSDEYTEQGVRLIQLQNIGDGIWLDENKKFISEEKFTTLKRHGAVPGDIAIAKMADPVARSCLLPSVAKQFIVVADCIKLTPDRSKYDAGFVSRAINSHNTRREAELKSSGTTRLRINLSALKTVHIWAPLLPEQSRIALVLETMDETIAKTEAVIAKLKQVRAGLLHDLLTRGLDEHGQLRDPVAHPEQFQDLPLGRIPREWRCSKFDEVIEGIDAGKSPDYPDQPAPPGEWGVLKVSAIWPEGFRGQENKWVTRAMHQIPAFQIQDGDLLISRSNTYELVGLVCIVSNAPPRLMLCDKTLRLRLKPNRGVNPFFALLLQTRTARTQIEVNATGTSGSMKNISQDVIGLLQLAYPDIEEQRRILAAVAPVTDGIEALASELAKLVALRSGLANDLLTGRVRVPEGV